ncbi:replication initiation factor domain-containing protein [Cupriavidus campinensis]|uniref:Replication initiation factor domain-containing protein n=1 Tax=Cupriavidus campinensis TaxID=151783 RepID=A0AAE9I865_9BURK|nr:replication initiation factor domain-containing protein [Cupriavidus campinensis]URF08056.1 replication initiation factor domain-containing protein [Cupriavidus campinensis]
MATRRVDPRTGEILGTYGCKSLAHVVGLSLGLEPTSGPSPRPVTRGELDLAEGIEGVKTKIDWLHASWEMKGAEGDPVWVRDMLFTDPAFRFIRREGKGLFGFAESEDIMYPVGGELHRVAVIAWGGLEKQANMGFLQITGTGCNALHLNDDRLDRENLRTVLRSIEATITRLDIAFDTEAIGVLDCWDAYQSGMFQRQSARPSYDQAGDWLEHQGRGRTLYIGKAKNGKLIRCYEKGKQLGDPESPWLRMEVQWGNRDRVIPYDALVDTDEYFAGAAPFFSTVLASIPRMVKTISKGAAIVARKLKEHLRDAYGRFVNQLVLAKFSDADIVSMMRREGAPKRMVPFVLNGPGTFFPSGFFEELKHG